jgi:hypothetical protein
MSHKVMEKDDDEEVDSMLETSSDDDFDDSTTTFSSTSFTSSSESSSSSFCSSSSSNDDDETLLRSKNSIKKDRQTMGVGTIPRLTIRLSPDKRAALKRLHEEEWTNVKRRRQQQEVMTPRRKGKKRKDETSPEVTQVQCDCCGKWRTLPRFIDPESLPDVWTCSMITWGNNTHRVKKSACPSLGTSTVHTNLPSVSICTDPIPPHCYRTPAATSLEDSHNYRPWTPPFDHTDAQVHFFTQDFPLISSKVTSPLQQQLHNCDNEDDQGNINLKMLRFFMDNQENNNTMFFSDDDEQGTQNNSHWVRRSVRLPNRAVLSSSGLTSLIEKLKCDDVTVEVLKMKEFLPHMDTPSHALDRVMDVLEKHNQNVQAIYIQNYNEGMRDAQVLHLLRVLQKGRIWCFNLGETYRVKMKTWKIFAKGLQKTNVTHCYLSEHTITPQIKEQMRNTIRENRKKHNRHIDPKNIDVIERCTHCWWNPINAKALRPFLKDAGKEYLLSPEVQNAKPLVGNSFVGCPPVREVTTFKKLNNNILP